MNNIAKIQPRELEDGTLPYPFFIDEKGMVGRQDFWKGKPYRLIGFHDKPETGDIKLLFNEFKKDMLKAEGMYAVFEDKDKTWHTHQSPIETIR